MLISGGMGEASEWSVSFRPVALWSHGTKMKVDFLDTQEIDVIIYYYVVDL